jgi:hypothetical protein
MIGNWRAPLWRAGAFLFIVVAGSVLAACGGAYKTAPPMSQPAGYPVRRAPARAPAAPSEILYVLHRDNDYKGTSIEAFDAGDTSSKPKPLYTIGPGYANDYTSLAVDGRDNLFVAGGGSYYGPPTVFMFAPGAKKPAAQCPLSDQLAGMYVAGGILYVSSYGYTNTITEYAEPLVAGSGCGKPLKSLTDKIADRQNASGLPGLLVDNEGNIFDLYSSIGGEPPVVMDEFAAGTRVARKFDTLQESLTPSHLTVDRNDDIVTNGSGSGSPNVDLAVFVRESKTPKLYYPIGDAQWLGVALGKSQTELFALSDYPAAAIHVFAFDPKKGSIGKQERLFGDIEPFGGALALYSK